MADPNEKKAPTIVRFYRFRNRLKEKTHGLAGGKGGISAEALEAAEKALESMAEDYPDWVSGLITKLAEQHGRCVDTPEDRRDHFEEINRIAHDMKGQGGTFGFPLITDFADSLYNFTTIRNDINDRMVELVKAHIDAMRAVIKGRIKGDGGEMGQQLSATLQKAIESYKKGD
ncbi:Hpt domain-containing protein [Iodidimonas nitroreducens]|uniref:Hpt domain-containing protein n=1 Tax=Iodidimonas nitroreducens TaxID=1236968 RepID=A0A5A7N4Q3_9PROT|nr:Hpt domain-containing protein [Iodidimonas nitroreducens]GAK32823.1 hpt domain protein [alpha proteobacterium Q-1]GER02967.1 Hpt domain-containing protein [Iodidimonas nitroreducens]